MLAFWLGKSGGGETLKDVQQAAGWHRVWDENVQFVIKKLADQFQSG